MEGVLYLADKQTTELRRTPLYDYYLEKGLKLMDFGGWALPVQFTKIMAEHEAVREAVGLFDCAHMGEIRITGENALRFVNSIITNDASKVKDNQSMYTAVTNETGGTLDDVIFYKTSDEHFTFTPNASNSEKILNWFNKQNMDEDVVIEDVSADFGLIAIQGPKAEAVLEKVTTTDLSDIKPFYFKADQTVGGVHPVIISRTGYTGEDGFEVYVPFDKQETIWKKLLEVGEEFGITECGLGARDTLRLEAGLALYGNDLSEDINPIEGGIGFTVKTGDKKTVDYPGKEALEAHRRTENTKMSRGFELTGKGIAREGMPIKLADGTEVGIVTSGTKSPTFKKAIGFLMIEKNHAQLDNEVFIDIRNKLVSAVLVKKDWLRR